MTKNMGQADRAARLVAGFAIMAAGFYMQSYWGFVGVILVLTSGIGLCPLYSIFGISTRPKTLEKDVIT